VKIEASNRAEASLFAVRHGLLPAALRAEAAPSPDLPTSVK
jgi:hypothetical protein